MRRALTFMLVCAATALAAPTGNAGVAMVTDLQGEATVTSAVGPGNLGILSELGPGTVVRLGAGATLVALYLADGDEYVFRGPTTVTFASEAPEVHDGAKPQRRSLKLGKDWRDVRIRPVGMAQGGLVMRSVRPEVAVKALAPDRTRTLDARPEFRWSGPAPDLVYTFELLDDDGRKLLHARVASTSITLPAGLLLRDGTTYSWKVSTSTPDGRAYADSAEFTMATTDVRAEVEAMRPSDSAPLSTRVAFAAWLDRVHFRDEARKYWTQASRERPDDARLRSMASP